jgi:hypothetical protein
MRKNHNAKLVETMIDLINCMKDRTTKEKFNDYKKSVVVMTIQVQNRLGNYEFASCKELKEYIINEKINDIENDFKN